MRKNLLTIALAALFSGWLGLGTGVPEVRADDHESAADTAAQEAVKPSGEKEEYFVACDPDNLATQTFEPLNKRRNNFLSVRIKGSFETPGPGYIEVWRKDRNPSLSATAAMELRILRPLNVYIEGQKDYSAHIDKTVVVHPDTKILRIHVVRDYNKESLTYYCEIKPVSLRARNEMDLE